MFYIQVETDGVKSQQQNIGLYEIIDNIGRRKNPNGRGATPFARGVEYLNKKLRRGYKTAIRRLVYCTQVKVNQEKGNHAIWKIHAHKARKIFNQIKRDVDPQYYIDVAQMAKNIMDRLSENGLPNCEDRGVSRLCVGSPYCPKLQECSGRYSAREKTCLQSTRVAIKQICRTVTKGDLI